MREMDRREFLAGSSAGLALLAFPRAFFPGAPLSPALPAPLGRIATWWRQAVRAEPSQNADWVASKGRDEVIPLYAAVVGEAPWPTNPVWYQTEGGYIHSGYVQPVEDAPSSKD